MTKTILKTILGITVCATAVMGADLVVRQAQLTNPAGRTVDGKLVMLNDRLIFVDDNRPDMSFVIPRSSVKMAHLENGRLTMDVTPPFTSSLGRNESQMWLNLRDTAMANNVIAWAGGDASGEAARSGSPGELRFDVKNGDQRGQLILGPREVRFESLTDADHSRTWAYSEIKELTRDDNELKIEPYHGDKYEFQFNNKATENTLYHELSDRIVSARTGRR